MSATGSLNSTCCTQKFLCNFSILYNFMLIIWVSGFQSVIGFQIIFCALFKLVILGRKADIFGFVSQIRTLFCFCTTSCSCNSLIFPIEQWIECGMSPDWPWLRNLWSWELILILTRWNDFTPLCWKGISLCNNIACSCSNKVKIPFIFVIAFLFCF